MRSLPLRGIAPLFAFLVLVAGPAGAQGSGALLDLGFDDTLAGAGGELPTQASGVRFVPGILGEAAHFDTPNQVHYAAAGNLDPTEGTIQFWVKPDWNGDDGNTHIVLTYGGGGGMLLGKDGANNLRSIFNRFGAGGQSEKGVAVNVNDWRAGEWRHVAYTWSSAARSLALYVDGALRAEQRFTGTLPSLPDVDFQLGGEGNFSYLEGALDALRIHAQALSASQIARDFLAGLAVSSLVAEPDSLRLMPTWRWTPRLTAQTDRGALDIPAAAADWSTSNPSVAVVDAGGRILAVGAGTATLTATVNGASASLAVTVRAPVLPPVVETIPPSLATPAANSVYQIPVLILRYLPTADGINLDTSVAPDFFDLGEISLDALKSRIDAFDRRVKFMLEEGSRFRGYRNPYARPSLGYRVVGAITVYEPTPPGRVSGASGGFPVYEIDYFSLFERFNVAHYVNDLGVKEIWLWNGTFDTGFPVYSQFPGHFQLDTMRSSWESNMSSPTTGDISNSNRDNSDLPVYSQTYVLYGQNIRRTQAEAVHNHGHQLESILSHVSALQDGNTDLFWKQFVGQDAAGSFVTGRAGWTHMPPNTTADYDYENPAPVSSDIEDWTPAGTGAKKLVSQDTWGSLPYAWPGDPDPPQKTESQWYIYWMQNMPGYGNAIPHGTDGMTNWWDFTGDWDNSVRAAGPQRGLYAPPVPRAASLRVTQTLSRSGPEILVAVTVANTGAVDIAGVQLTASSLRVGSLPPATTATALPATLGTLASGSAQTAVLRFPGSAGAAGAPAAFSVSGAYAGGRLSSAARVTLP